MDLIVKRKLYRVWLSKPESVSRELNVYVVDCELDRGTSFKILVLCHVYMYFRYFRLLLMTAMFKFYSRKSNYF